MSWNASADALASALGALGAGPDRVARELGLEAAQRAEAAAGAAEGVGARTQVTAGLGAWDGADAGVRFVVVFQGAPARFGPSGNFPLLTLDASSLHSTDHSALVVANTSTLVAGEVPALDAALKGSAILALPTTVEVGVSGPAPLDDGRGVGAAEAEAAVFDRAAGTFSRTLRGLAPGEAYHVRVSAFNGFGNAFGDAAYATPPDKYGLEKYGVR